LLSLLNRRPVRACLSVGTAGAVAAAISIAISSGGAAVTAASAAPTGAIAPVMSCSALAAQNFLDVPGNATQISSATLVAATSTNPEYCNVQGTIAPQTQFAIYLPTQTWTGRYLQTGCGGFCGSVRVGVSPSSSAWPAADSGLGGDFVEASDNEGHSGLSGLWALDDQKLRLEYGYESEQSLYEVAHAIIKTFYGQLPTYNYYDGGSDGGREAMEMAERYPDDFNGISAGAPEIIAGPLNTEHHIWSYRVNIDANGNAILTTADMPVLHAAVMSACAGDDGVNDGIITDPQDCQSKLPQILASVQCAPGQSQGSPSSPSCLTSQQVDVARLLYRGPADPQGTLLYPGGLPLGSELGWGQFAIPAASSDGSPVPATSSPALIFGSEYSEDMYTPNQVGPTPDQWQFSDSQFYGMFPEANIQDAMSTDLSAFRAHGGKLIMWHGFADHGIPPTGTIDYYDALVKRDGGLQSTEQFARLFMFPTVYHVSGGYANSQFAVVPSLVQWVEQGVAPSSITATDTIDNTTLTRPVYPYPDIPAYNGSGDPNQASSFHPVVAPAYSDHSDYTSWIGNYLFDQPIGIGDQAVSGHSRSRHVAR
jgi:feruloyl esterase